MGYTVACSSLFSTVACGVQGGVLMVTRERPEFWDIEYRLFHDPNLVICKIIPSSHRTPPHCRVPPPVHPGPPTGPIVGAQMIPG